MLFVYSFDSKIRVQEAYSAYEKNSSFDSIAPNVFGRMLMNLFPRIQKIKQRIPGENNKFTYIYKHLAIACNNDSDTSSAAGPLKNPIVMPSNPTSTIDQIAQQLSFYLCTSNSHSPVHGTHWFIESFVDGTLTVSKFQQEERNGHKVYAIVKMHKDFSIEMFYAGKQVDKLCYCYSNKLYSMNSLLNLLQEVDNAKRCKGITNPSFESLPENTFDVSRKLIDIKEFSKCTVSGAYSGQSKRRAVDCSGFQSSNVLGSFCHNCDRVRRILAVQLVRVKHRETTGRLQSDKTNKRYLTVEQKENKEDEEKRRRRNAEKRVAYWKKKVLEERKMRLLSEKDSQDVEHMFNYLENKGTTFSDNPKMAILWEMQREAVAKANNKRAIRWHPQ